MWVQFNRVVANYHMAYLSWPLIQGAVLWSSYLLNSFIGNKPVLEAFTYRTEPVTVHNLYNNVATKDFDGQGGHYPIELLPTGVLMSENVNVSSSLSEIWCIEAGFD